MADKIKKIREWVKARLDENASKQSLPQFYGMMEEDARFLDFLDSLQEEPKGSVWHEKDKEPCEDRQVLVCLSGNYYVDFYHKEDKRFYMFFKPKHYLREVDRWAYIDDIINLSNVQRIGKDCKEPVSEDLEEAVNNYIKENGYDGLDSREEVKYIANHFANWQKEKLMAKAINTEASYTMSVPSICISLPLGVKVGDKVKVIVIKED